MSDPLVARWLNMPRCPSNADFDSLAACRADRLELRRALRLRRLPRRTSPTWLGAVIASRRHRDNFEIAYLAGALGRAARSHEHAPCGCSATALFEAGVGRLELRTHPDNEPSQRLAMRCGFRREGRERRSIWLHGKREDAIVWSLLAGRPAVIVHSFRERSLLVIPISFALGLVTVLAAVLAGAAPRVRAARVRARAARHHVH
mgnify:CR=1 FL=1